MDLGFLIETSATEGSSEFKKVLEFVDNVIGPFQQGTDTRIGAISYSNNATAVFDFQENINKKDATKKLNTITWNDGGARIDKALELAKSAMFNSSAGMRRDTPRVCNHSVQSIKSISIVIAL